MNQFAKIITLKNQQVVVMKDFDHEDESDMLWILTNIDGMLAQVKVGFKSEDARDNAFNEYDEMKAQEFVDGVVSMFNDEHF